MAGMARRRSGSAPVPSRMVAVLASSHPEPLLDEAGVLGGQFLAVDPGQEATH